MTRHLIVPADGLLTIRTDDQEVLDVDTEVGGDGTLVHLVITPHEDPIRVVYRLAGATNDRARRMVADLGGPHLMFTGTVVLSDLDQPTAILLAGKYG